MTGLSAQPHALEKMQPQPRWINHGHKRGGNCRRQRAEQVNNRHWHKSQGLVGRRSDLFQDESITDAATPRWNRMRQIRRAVGFGRTVLLAACRNRDLINARHACAHVPANPRRNNQREGKQCGEKAVQHHLGSPAKQYAGSTWSVGAIPRPVKQIPRFRPT